MSENIPVVSIPVDNSGLQEAVSLFEKLTQYAEKYKKYSSPGPGMPPPPAGSGTPSSGSASGEEGGAGGGNSGNGSGFLNRLNRFTKGIDKSFNEAGKTIGKLTGQLKKLFEMSLGWAVKFALLGTGGAFGYDLLAKRNTQQLMGAQANRMTVGQDNAARNIYGNRFSGYQGTIEALTRAQQDGTSKEARALRQLGIDPRKGAGDNLPLVYERMAPVIRNSKDSGMGFAQIRAQGLDSLIGGEADANQILANSAEIPGLSRDYREQSKKLDLPEDVSRSSQRLTTTFSNNLDRIANAFKTSLSKLDGPIEKLSVGFTDAVEAFLNGPNGKQVFEYIADGINTLGDWLNSDDFKSDVKSFTKGLADGAEVVSGFVKSLSNLKGWIDDLTGAGNDRGNSWSIANVGNKLAENSDSAAKWVRSNLQNRFGWDLSGWKTTVEREQQNSSPSNREPVQRAQSTKRVSLNRDYARLSKLADDPEVKSFLDLIAKAEGTFNNPDGGYNTMFGGGQFAGQEHPRVKHPFRQTDGKWNVTTAAGRYQFVGPTWDESAEKLGLQDFSPRSQDIAALHRIEARGQLDNVLNGDFDKAVAGLGGEWASLPSSKYAQPKHSMETIRDMYNSRSTATRQTVMVEVKQAPGADYIAQIHANMPPPLFIPQ